LQLFYDWTIVFAENGWTDIYEDYRSFKNDKSVVMSRKKRRSSFQNGWPGSVCKYIETNQYGYE
ncbi:hypothetical protein ACUOA5_37805, partial [Escherichia coli]